MSGYQSLHDLITEQLADSEPQAVIDILTHKIYTEWMPAEAEAVNEAKRQAEKQKKQLEKVRTENEQAIVTANAPNLSERDFTKIVGGF